MNSEVDSIPVSPRNHERAAVVIGIPSPSPVTFDTTDPVLKCTESIVIKLL